MASCDLRQGQRKMHLSCSTLCFLALLQLSSCYRLGDESLSTEARGKSAEEKAAEKAVMKSEAKEPMMFLSLAALSLKYAWWVYNGVTTYEDVTAHIAAEAGFASLSESAVQQIDTVIHSVGISGFLESRSVLHGQYMELQILRESMNKIKDHCQPAEGILHAPHAWVFGDVDKNVSTGLANVVDAVQVIMEDISDGVFCVHLQKHLLHELKKFIRILSQWEQSTGQTWFPIRAVSNRFLAGPGTAEHREYLMKHIGLSDSEINKVLFMQIRHFKSGWIHHHTSLGDSLQQDQAADPQIKEAAAESLREIRLIFQEMSSVSRKCSSNAEQLACFLSGRTSANGANCDSQRMDQIHLMEGMEAVEEFQLCIRCRECCNIKEERTILNYMVEAMTQHMEKHAGRWMQFWDYSALVTIQAAMVFAGGLENILGSIVTSMMWVGARLSTGFRMHRPGLCSYALHLLSNHSLVKDALDPDIKDAVEETRESQDVWDVNLQLPMKELGKDLDWTPLP